MRLADCLGCLPAVFDKLKFLIDRIVFDGTKPAKKNVSLEIFHKYWTGFWKNNLKVFLDKLKSTSSTQICEKATASSENGVNSSYQNFHFRKPSINLTLFFWKRISVERSVQLRQSSQRV